MKFSGTHFCKRLNKPRAIVWLEGVGKLKKRNPLTPSLVFEPVIILLVA
jgi:hypothetical protein